MDPLGGVFFIYFFYIFSSNSILDESVLKSVIKPQGQPTTVSSYMLKTLLGYPQSGLSRVLLDL